MSFVPDLLATPLRKMSTQDLLISASLYQDIGALRLTISMQDLRTRLDFVARPEEMSACFLVLEGSGVDSKQGSRGWRVLLQMADKVPERSNAHG